nr:ISAs1 family transposase [Streptomyces canus]
MSSSLIGVLRRHCADIDSTCPDPELPQLTCLVDVLDRIPDPRRVRGRRYRLGSLLALCLVAVLGGATSLAAIARFATDTDCDLRERLGLTAGTPNASTLGRLLARLDGDALDDAVGTWLARYTADPVDEPGDRLIGLAVDGKTVRGSRTDIGAVHLLAAALHACQTVIAQRQITAKSNEIPAFAPLLARIDLRGVVVTADAMHTQRAHAEHVVTAGGHYLLVVKGRPSPLSRSTGSGGVKALVDGGNEIAEKLDLSAGYYHEAEEYAVGVTKDYVVAATAIRPYPARTRRGCRGARSGRRRRGVGRRTSPSSRPPSPWTRRGRPGRPPRRT